MRQISVLVLISIFSFIAGYYLTGESSHDAKSTELNKNITAESSFYTCPMHPHIHQEKAGECPICGMSLVEKKLKIENKNSIFVNPAVVNNFAIKIAAVKRGTLYRELLTYGYVSKVESIASQTIKSPVSGKISFISTRKNQHETQKGEHLVSIDSEEWKKLQQAYLDALDKKDSRLIRQITQKLKQTGFLLKEIQALKLIRKPTKTFKIYANKQAILNEFNLSINQKISQNQSLFSLAPVYPIIGYAEVFEGQWRWLEAGHKSSMIIRSVPGVEWQGEVLEVDDMLMNRSRTIKTKLGFKSVPDVLLKPGMQANFTIFASPKHEVLYVPQDAVIRTQNKTQVILALGNGRFKPQDVKIGLEDGRNIEIVDGLEEGMKIVSSGQFLLDSESQLHSELQRIHSNSGNGFD